MQNRSFFKSSWNDITQSPSWYVPLIKLALIGLIPIVGQIVVLSYIYGWARDIAWNYKTNLPQKVFDNKDGRLWSRGFKIFCYNIVLGIILVIAVVVMAGFGISLIAAGGFFAVLGGLYLVCMFLLTIPAIIIVSVLFELGSLHIALYNRFGAGFKFKRICKMMLYKKEWTGRLIVLTIVVGFVSIVISSIAFSINQFLALVPAGILFGTGSLAASGAVISFVLLLNGIINSFVGIFANTFIVRAYGYYVAGFDVASWGSEDDPLPFELSHEDGSDVAATPEAPSNKEACNACEPENIQEQDAASEELTKSSDEERELIEEEASVEELVLDSVQEDPSSKEDPSHNKLDEEDR